jgi:hypothetical protein
MAPRSPKPAPPRLTTYWERTHEPLQCLWFLLPLLLAYEAGMFYVARIAGSAPAIRAEVLLHRAFEAMGVTGILLPPLIVVAVLIAWHLVKRDRFSFEWPLYGLMLLESVVLAVPLLVFSAVLFREPMMAVLQAGGLGHNLLEDLLLSVGAGIYEELLFRLIAIALLHLLLADLLALPEHVSAGGAVLVSAVAFALYHFRFTDEDPFHLGRFVFYTTAGIYFAGVYVLRGFGIVVATHAVFDIIVVTARYVQTR